MINTDKYEGHTPAPWIVGYPNCDSFPENAVFIDGGSPVSEGYDGRWSYSPFFSTTSSGKEISKELGIMLKHRGDGGGEFDGGNTPLADVLLMADAPLLLEEVKRLREELSKVEQERDKYSGALELAIEQIGYTGMDIEYEERMRKDRGITVYGDEYLRCDCEGCSGFVKDKYDDYIIKGRGDQESVKCDDEDCPYFYGDDEE